MNWHPEILPPPTRQTLALLKKSILAQNFYLAGGTGLALQIGHRFSEDLDFFTPDHFNEDVLIQEISTPGEFNLEKKESQTIIAVLNKTKLSFLGYSYPLIDPPQLFEGAPVASIADIACMKIDAIASRGAKRDFIDVYSVANEIMPLPEILKKFQEKYTSVGFNLVHVKKSLVYFDDAERDPAPRMIRPVDWGKVRSFFESEILKLA